MNDFELTDTQREALSILLERYRETEQPVSGSYIAEQADRSPSTISKYMKELRSLNLVVSLRGQKGGYRPTANAFGVLDNQDAGESESLYLVQGYDRVDRVVEGIEFPTSSTRSPALRRFGSRTPSRNTRSAISFSSARHRGRISSWGARSSGSTRRHSSI